MEWYWIALICLGVTVACFWLLRNEAIAAILVAFMANLAVLMAWQMLSSDPASLDGGLALLVPGPHEPDIPDAFGLEKQAGMRISVVWLVVVCALVLLNEKVLKLNRSTCFVSSEYFVVFALGGLAVASVAVPAFSDFGLDFFLTIWAGLMTMSMVVLLPVALVYQKVVELRSRKPAPEPADEHWDTGPDHAADARPGS